MTRHQPKKQESYHCSKCKDQGFIFTIKDGYEMARKCECEIKKETLQKIDNSGLSDLFKIKTFGSYKTNENYQKSIKGQAMQYTKDFLDGDRHSLAILGQSGVGKTHIMTAVAGQLIKRNIEVKYYIADEIIQKLNSLKYDEEGYNKEFSKIANAQVLFIDDLFKSSIKEFYQVESINQDDLRVIFQIINYRYNKNKPILLNSEIHYERFKKIDQAIIGRINEMCNYEYLISVKPDENKNYRLKRL